MLEKVLYRMLNTDVRHDYFGNLSTHKYHEVVESTAGGL